MIQFSAYSLPAYVLSLAFGYLLGSVMFGMALTKLAGIGDPRSFGSGNPGATNVLRSGRKDIAAATLVLDALKATFAVAVARAFGMDTALVAGFGAFIGHLYPVWLKFKGGKGVATYLGVLLGLSMSGFVIFAASWLCAVYATRFSSAAALAASLITPVAFLIMGEPILALFFAVLSALLVWRHRENIRRLRSGEESKITVSL